MAFETILQAYNAYKNTPAKTLEARAQAINADIAANPSADIQAYNVELEAIERVIEERGQATPKPQVPEVAFTAKGKGDAQDAAATPEYRSAFFKHLQGAELTADERRAFDLVNAEKRSGDAFNNLSNAAAVIPTTTLDQIVTKARDMGGIMGISRAFNMPANISIPVATPGSAAQWHVEGQAVETEMANTVPVVFGAYEIMKVISISAATRTMSISAFESYLVDELTNSVMATLAGGMVNGTGSGQATGVVSGITWGEDNQVTFATALTYKNIIDAISMLKRGYAKNAKFVMSNKTLFQDIYGLVDENKRPIFVADPTEAGKGRILGFEAVIDDYMADHDIVLGDYRYYGFNMPAGIAVDMSRESSFKSGLVDYRALAIADAKPIVDEAFVRITKGA